MGRRVLGIVLGEQPACARWLGASGVARAPVLVLLLAHHVRPEIGTWLVCAGRELQLGTTTRVRARALLPSHTRRRRRRRRIDDDDDDERLEYPRYADFTRVQSVPLLAFIGDGDEALVALAGNDVQLFARLVSRPAVEFRLAPVSHERVRAQTPEGALALYYRLPQQTPFAWELGASLTLFEHLSRDPVARAELVATESDTPATGRAYVRLEHVYSENARAILEAR